MSLITPTPIPGPALPMPDASDLGTWPARMAETLRWLREDAVPGVYVQSGVAYQNALESESAAANAQAAANFGGVWASMSGAVAAGVSVWHASRFWLSLQAIANVATVQPGTDATRWAPLTVDASAVAYSTTTVSAVLDLMAADMGRMNTYRNKVLNGNFAGNVRGLTGSLVLAASERGHDTWRAGAAGCSLSVAGSVATITAGIYRTTVDGAIVFESGDHVLSWTGTATCSINGAAAVASPAVVSLTAGANVSLEFGVGTFGLVQLEKGTTASAFQPLAPSLQRQLLNWYVRSAVVLIGGSNARIASSARSSSLFYLPDISLSSMRAVPSIALLNNSDVQYFNASSVWTATTLTASVSGDANTPRILTNTNTGDATGTGAFVRRTTAADVVAIVSAELS